MCQFFSCVTKGDGQLMYFDWEQRRKIIAKEIRVESADSHTSIADYYGFKGKAEDRLNKYEYNPLTKKFKIDQINTTDDSEYVNERLNDFDWTNVVEPLVVKPIVNPFVDRKALKVSKNDILMLRDWASVWASVWDSVWGSVRDSMGGSVWDSVCDSAWDSVWGSVRDSMGGSVWGSVWGSAWASVWGSVGGYASSFLKIKYPQDYSSLNKLWEKGLVPSFDGKVWRLHGYQGKVLKTITMEELKMVTEEPCQKK